MDGIHIVINFGWILVRMQGFVKFYYAILNNICNAESYSDNTPNKDKTRKDDKYVS